MTERTGAAWSRRHGRGRERDRRGSVRRRSAGALGGVAAAAGLVAVLTVALVVRRHAAVIVHQCLPGDGFAGWLGVRLALLRVDAACPEGALALGGDGRNVVGVTVMVALPVLLAHLAGAGLGVGLLRTFGRVIRGVVALAAGALLRIPGRVALRTTSVRPMIATAQRGPHRDVVGRARWRRGPPVHAFA